MKIQIIGSTKKGNILKKEEALEFGATLAGICYMPDSFEALKNEDKEKNKNRQRLTLENGHHSVYGHTSLNLLLEDTPKIVAMLLNNEKVYVTSEKSARYTKMRTSGLEEKLFNKWNYIFERKISEKYPKIDAKKIKKLAQENSRYLISVFTPTTLTYTTNFRQLNYVMHRFNNFIENANNTRFNEKIKEELNQFNNLLKDYFVDELKPTFKNLSFFDIRPRKEVFDETYSINYEGSFAQLAQAQRHRTLDYSITLPKIKEFFTPPIINNEKENWLEDITSVSDNYPQGQLIKINERGTFENLILKAYERLCGHAQLEIQNQTSKTLETYLEKTNNLYIRKELEDYLTGPRCTFKDYTCTNACPFGKKALERLI